MTLNELFIVLLSIDKTVAIDFIGGSISECEKEPYYGVSNQVLDYFDATRQKKMSVFAAVDLYRNNEVCYVAPATFAAELGVDYAITLYMD